MIMAAVMAAGMVPPLAMALRDRPRPQARSRRSSARTARPRGCSAPRSSPRARSRSPRPTRCASSPRSILGGAVTGAICMGIGRTSQAPHGGIFVFFAIGNLPWFVLAIVAGIVVVGALAVIALKRWAHRRPVGEAEESSSPQVAVA